MRMSTSLLYHRFGLVGYHYVRQDFVMDTTIFRIEQPRERLRCSHCGSDEVWAQGGVERFFRGLPIGNQPTLIELKVPRVFCFGCGNVRQVKVPFADPKSGSSDQCVFCFMEAQDLEFEELVIAEAIGLTLHELDLVVGSFQRPR